MWTTASSWVSGNCLICLCSRRKKVKTKIHKDVLALNSIVLNVFGRRMAVTQSSHKTAGHKAEFPEQKENTYSLHSILYPVHFSCSHKGIKGPSCPNHPCNTQLSSFQICKYPVYNVWSYNMYTRVFPWHPPALPQAAEAHIEEDHLLGPFTYLWWYILQWRKFFPYTHTQRTQPKDLVRVPQNSRHPAQDCNTQH